MAVFTPLHNADVQSFLQDYALGELQSLQGIAAGIENSNFFVTTDQGDYVLTLFEVLTAEQLPFYVQLVDHLAQQGVAVARPIRRRDGALLSTLKGKPALLSQRLQGRYESAPTVAHCQRMGAVQARMHLASLDYTGDQPNLRGLAWWQEKAPAIRPFLTPEQAQLFDEQLQLHRTLQNSATWLLLPKGACHCDLFRDNVLFDTGLAEDGLPSLSGIIDFYFAGVDTWLFDIAVAVNDWCSDTQTGALDPARCHAWLRAYHSVRPLTPIERDYWPYMLQAAAMRFWTSRLFDFHHPRASQQLTPHDPSHFERLLRHRVQHLHFMPSLQ